MPLTPEEKAEIGQTVQQAIAANNAAQAEALKPLADSVMALTKSVGDMVANQKALSDTLTANARAEEASMREAVKAKFGEVVANSLSGEPLKEMFKQCGDAAQLAANSGAGAAAKTGVPDLKAHFGEQK